MKKYQLVRVSGTAPQAEYEKFLKYISVAQAWAGLSKDPSTKVGAMAFDIDGGEVSQGYNGFPRGTPDKEEWLNDRAQKYPRIIHAEANLVAQAARRGTSLYGTVVLLTALHPCTQCAGLLIQAGVHAVIAPRTPANDRWDAATEMALQAFRDAGVSVFLYQEV